jgi:putative phage-type endonuclease
MAELVCGTADRDAWLAARRTGITATDITVIMGLVSWDSAWALWHRKKGLLPEVEASDRMRLGSWLEDRIINEWHRSSASIRDVSAGSGLYRSSARPWQLATPDRGILRDGELVGVLECKTSSTRDGWGPDGSAVVPAHVRAQVLWQMDTLEVGTGHVAVVFLPSGEFRSYTIGHTTLILHVNGEAQPGGCAACDDQRVMRIQGGIFLSRLQDGQAPAVDGSPVTTDALRHLNAEVHHE